MGSIYEARELFGLAIEGMKGVIDAKLVDRCTALSSNVGESHVSCSLSTAVHTTHVSSPPHPHFQSFQNQQMQQQGQQRQTTNVPLHSLSESSAASCCTPQPCSSSFDRSESGSSTSTSPSYDFLRPIYVSEDEFLLNNAPLIKLTISLLFNLALSDHAIAMSMMTTEGCAGENSSVSARTASITTAANAIFLYQLAYCLQIKDGIELSKIHTMGMINNVGRLLSLLGDAKESENCFRHLLKKVMVQSVEESSRVDPGGGGGRADTTASLTKGQHEELGQLEGFLNNIMTVVLRNNLSSPAA